MEDTVTSVQDDANARVALGAALLDEKVPGWAGRVDLDTLDMKDQYACVGSQATGQIYTTAMRTLGVESEDSGAADYIGGSPYGFHAWSSYADFHRGLGGTDWDAYEDARSQEWEALDTAWRTAIAAR